MLFAALGDTSYDLVLVLHIISVIVAFAPAAAHPLTEARFRKEDGDEGAARFYRAALVNTRRVYFPALVLAGVFGGALIGLSKTPGPDGEVLWKFEQTWIWLGIVIWVALCGVVFGVIAPAEKAIAAGDSSAVRRLSAGGGIATLMVLVQLYLMVFKPGA
jgi:hypothetical protein